MASTTVSPPGETLAEGLTRALTAARDLAELLGEVGDQATLRTCFTVHVTSEALVDGAAAIMGTEPRWTAPGRYQAVKCTEAVTVTVAYIAGAPPETRLDGAAIETVCAWAQDIVPAASAA